MVSRSLRGRMILSLFLVLPVACSDEAADTPAPFAAMVITDTHVLNKTGMDAERIRTLVSQLIGG